ncbi:acyltransferase family-domain-containing protein, partial [Plectosphaerella plurivora]
QRRNKRLRSGLSFLLSTTKALLPAYLTTFLSWMASLFLCLTDRAVDRPKRQPPKPTAYLDGLRGVAALIVYMYDAVYLFYPRLYHGYGVDHENRFFLQLPIIRVFHSGGGSVCVFFFVSGFVLTISPLTKIHKRASNSDVLATVVGTIFRRPFRLFLPIIASTLMNALAQYNRLKFRINHGGGLREPEATLWLQLVDWYWATVDHIDRFRHINGRIHLQGHKYDGHTWTIPFEVKGSLLVMIFLMMFGKVKRWVHVVVALGITYWLVVNGDIDSAVFFCGILLAELSIVAPGRAGPSENCSTDKSPGKSTRGLRYLRIMRHVAIVLLFIFSLHLLSFPDSKAPGFEFLRFAPDFYTDPKSPVSLQTF